MSNPGAISSPSPQTKKQQQDCTPQPSTSTGGVTLVAPKKPSYKEALSGASSSQPTPNPPLQRKDTIIKNRSIYLSTDAERYGRVCAELLNCS
jgi:hypothetical protein